MPAAKKAYRLLLATLCLHAVLVATHQGEFWPFSIYPMFSQAGRVWERAIVRHVTDEELEVLAWESFRFEALPGDAFPVEEHGIPQNELSDYLTKTGTWGADERSGLRAFFSDYFANEPGASPLVIMTAQGPDLERGESGSMLIDVVPRFVISSDTLLQNPYR